MKKLLLVDDEETVLTGMRRYFRACGFEVDCAKEREEAEALISEVAYDAMILDLGLTPGLGPSGLQVVGWARAQAPAARIVVLTAFGSPDVQSEAMRLGANAFLQKPQPLEEIRAALGFERGA